MPCIGSYKFHPIQETTTTTVETSADDLSTSNSPITATGTTDHRTDEPSSWTNIPQPEPRTVGPSVPLSTVLPLTTMMTQTSEVDSELPPQRECSQQDYDFMKENLLLFNSAKLTDSKKPGNEYLVSIMFSHYDQNNNGQLEAEELWQAAERDHLGQLSKSCILADMLLFDDSDRDGSMSINEFYLAFSKLDKGTSRYSTRTEAVYGEWIPSNNIFKKCVSSQFVQVFDHDLLKHTPPTQHFLRFVKSIVLRVHRLQ
ncbi:follistatin-related protein 5 [Trichonephila clavipes]|nr:follistatin-related protein 5 [Trichonephila clavipes]